MDNAKTRITICTLLFLLLIIPIYSDDVIKTKDDKFLKDGIVLTENILQSTEETAVLEAENENYGYIYSKESYQVPIYITKTITEEIPLYEEKCKKEYDAVNDTYYDICTQEIKSYDYADKEIRVIDHYDTEYRIIEQIGVMVDGVEVKNANIADGKLVTWSVQIGDRNFEKFGKCREYEAQKGICEEVELK